VRRLAGTDYLLVQTAPSLVESGFAKSFLIPYVDRYIDRVDLEAEKVLTTGAKAILEAS